MPPAHPLSSGPQPPLAPAHVYVCGDVLMVSSVLCCSTLFFTTASYFNAVSQTQEGRLDISTLVSNGRNNDSDLERGPRQYDASLACSTSSTMLSSKGCGPLNANFLSMICVTSTRLPTTRQGRLWSPAKRIALVSMTSMCSHAKGEAALLEVEKAIGKERFQDMDKSDRIHRDLFGVHLHSQVCVGVCMLFDVLSQRVQLLPPRQAGEVFRWQHLYV